MLLAMLICNDNLNELAKITELSYKEDEESD
jgi:hypothetical protein